MERSWRALVKIVDERECWLVFVAVHLIGLPAEFSEGKVEAGNVVHRPVTGMSDGTGNRVSSAMPKKIDDILNPKPPDAPPVPPDPTAEIRARIVEQLRIAAESGDALSVFDLMEIDVRDFPPIGKGGLFFAALSAWPATSILNELVEQGVATSADSDGQTYYWLADGGSADKTTRSMAP